MKYLLSILFVFPMLPLIWSVSMAESQGEAAVLESITYQRDGGGPETVTFKLNGNHIPKIFKIKGEKPRLVLDFFDTQYSLPTNSVIDTKGDLVKRLRVGVHKDPVKIRVVVDVGSGGEYRFEQDFQPQKNILNITFFPGDVREKTKPKEKTAEIPGSEVGPIQAEKTSTEGVSEIKPEPRPSVAVSALSQQDTESAGPPAPAIADKARQPKAAEHDSATSNGTAVTAPDPGSSSLQSGQPPEQNNQLLAQAGEAAPAPADPILRDVYFDSTTDNGEMVLFKLNDFYPPIVFGIEKGNPRVVCDFLDTDLAGGVRSVIRAEGNYVDKIRIARHQNPDKVRVVLDLVPNRNYDLQQVFFKEDNLFVIIINEFEEKPVPVMDVSSGLKPKR